MASWCPPFRRDCRRKKEKDKVTAVVCGEADGLVVPAIPARLPQKERKG
jgi:hypothetical protein